MKWKLHALNVSFLLMFIISCSTGIHQDKAKIKFEVTEYDFGELETNGDGDCTFLFNNTGETPLIINDVKTSCGCTVPEWTKKPVKPGKTGEIRIVYDTSHPGAFNKTITVFYNGDKSPQKLTIKGSVKYPWKIDVSVNE